MTTRQLRWLLLAIAGGLVSYVIVRRREQLAEAIPEPLMQQAERIVIPWTSLERKTATENLPTDEQIRQADTAIADEPEEHENDDSMRRKVSRRYRISFGGRQYGPLPESLVGEYVEVETRDDKLYILHNGTPVANFTLQS